MSTEFITQFIVIAMMLLGLLGLVVPLLPGPALIVAAAGLHRLILGEEKSAGMSTLVILCGLLIFCCLIDWFSSVAGAKWMGASRGGAIGAVIGAVAGIFFMPLGLLLGPLAGALIGELIGGRKWKEAGKAAMGTVLGTVGGMVAKGAISLLMIGVFWWDALR